ncbi:hypothetical protein E2562_027479 [Oryza meyeriana var. granulata]|uniref:Uncharacterized protein n=1 Tax=Oryza meyeriana var. granulata TaxID=110450 RepID=A0A6G1E2A8_9ORYZ|nr:hypothetical protein E2562_027479 [Oryza meyeriana var. granulata]
MATTANTEETPWGTGNGMDGRDGGEADGWAMGGVDDHDTRYRSGEDGDGKQARLAGSPAADEGDDR